MCLERELKRASRFCLVFSLAAALAGCGGGGTGGTSTSGSTPSVTLAVSPYPITVGAGASFFITVTATATGTTATPTITLGTLPAGLSTTATFPMAVPTAGATIVFTTSSSIAPGNIIIPMSVAAGTATQSASVGVTVSATPIGQGYFIYPLYHELQVERGGTVSVQGQIGNDDGPDYEIALSATGLPDGVTATFNPPAVEADTQTFTMTLAASSSAALLQNMPINMVGTPAAANLTPFTLSYLLDVTGTTNNAGWSNQTGYVFTRATPSGAIYDSVHKMIYSANQVWDRIDIINDQTRAIVKSISIPGPADMDISPDGSTVWVATGSQVMYGINTTTFQATRYLLPRYPESSAGPPVSWGATQVVSLADGTVLLPFSSYSDEGVSFNVIWNPATNILTPFILPASVQAGGASCFRSGDGQHVFIFGSSAYRYDIPSGAFAGPIFLSGAVTIIAVAVNEDGSRVAIGGLANPLFGLYDENLNLIGPLPGDGGTGNFPFTSSPFSGFVFSPDGQSIYEETEATPIPLIATINVATQQTTALSPAMGVIPPYVMLDPPFYLPSPFAVDANGMVLGIQYDGIAFEDPTPNLNYSILDPESPIYMQTASVYSGPVSGGTTSNFLGGEFSITPDVYYGVTKGTATLNSFNEVSTTSPPGGEPGPVDLKMLFADGTEVFDPQFFTYGLKIEDALVSGGSPRGGTPAELDAFGLPLDPSQNTVTVGGGAAKVTSTETNFAPFVDEQTDMNLSFTTSAGSPGWADITITNPNGTATLPRSFFFAKSVEDYATPDSPTAVLYDSTRNQLYLSAGNHIDVFSLSSLTFITPLSSPMTGSQFQGLALTLDGKDLLAADLTNGALAVFDPDAPSQNYEINLAGSVSSSGSCNYGPAVVAPDNQGNAVVAVGYQPGPTGCGFGGLIYLANLAGKTAALLNVASCGGQSATANYLKSTNDGSLIVAANPFRIYLPGQQACIATVHPGEQYTATVSGDGNVIGLDWSFVDSSGNIVGRPACPAMFYPASFTGASSPVCNFDPYVVGGLAMGSLQSDPLMNDAGSLYFWAYPNYVDIIDVQHGTPAMRFGLTEKVTNTTMPMALDNSGQRIFLITNEGLTIIDLGNAPLSVGHFSQTSASPGNQIGIRGSGFENGITASLGGVAASLTFTDSETLTLTIPGSNAGPEDLVLTNPDGTTYTLQNAIDVQ